MRRVNPVSLKRATPPQPNSPNAVTKPSSPSYSRSLARGKMNPMSRARYVHWHDQGMWLGYFEEFPDYLTQGETLAELEDNLRDLYKDLTSGEI